MSKRVPVFKTDEEAEAFLEQDLSDYLDPANLQRIHFEYQPKDTQLNLRLSKNLLQAVKARAAASTCERDSGFLAIIEALMAICSA